MIKRQGRKADGAKASPALPSIGCYVNEEYAREYHVSSSSEAYGNGIGRNPVHWAVQRRLKALKYFILLMVAVVALMFGFSRHVTSEYKFLNELQHFGQRALSLVKFPIEEVHIVGHEHTQEKAIIKQLGDIWNSSLVSMNTLAARKRIEALPWVKRADVERVFPHGINIYVEERKPVGRFVQLSGTYVFDSTGFVIEKSKVGAHMDLPIYDGAGAPEASRELREVLSNFDDLQPLVTKFSRIDKRRWTLKMHSGMEILLPEDGMEVALSRLRALQSQYNIFNRQVASLDLRLEDRITLRPKNSPNVKILSTPEGGESAKVKRSDSLSKTVGGI